MNVVKLIKLPKLQCVRVSRWLLTSLVFLSLSACASDGGSKEMAEGTASTQATQTAITETTTKAKATTEKTSQTMVAAVTEAEVVAMAEPEQASEKDLSQVANVVEPVQIVDQCKKQPYAKYEKASRASIAKGWEATKEGKYGVGFRDEDEYKKWGKTHSSLFKTVSKACDNLSVCAKKYGKNQKKKCKSKAMRFNAWQRAAENFSKKIKTVEVTQPPVLCSIIPSSKDSSECYSLLADRINGSCVSGECLEVATCFQGLGFLDDAINQAESACKFVHQKLNQCRGYVEATGRRQSEFNQCAQMYKQLDVEIIPVL